MNSQRDMQGDEPNDVYRSGARNGCPVETTGFDQGLSPLSKRVCVFGAIGTIVVALLGMLGWLSGPEFLHGFRDFSILMSPVAAISLIVLASVLLALMRCTLSATKLALLGGLAILVVLLNTLDVAGHLTGRDLNIVSDTGDLGGLHIGCMSIASGVTFLFAGIAVLALVVRRGRNHGGRTRLGHLAGGLGSLALASGFFFCLVFLWRSPLLYSQDAAVPMTLSTAFAFLTLGVAAVGAAGDDVIPICLFDAVGRRVNLDSERKTLLTMAFIMVASSATVMTIMAVTLYRHEIQRHRMTLQLVVASQKSLIATVVRYDAQLAHIASDRDPDFAASVVMLNQLMDNYERIARLDDTVEVALAQRVGDSISFVVQRRTVTKDPATVAFDSKLAEPMRRALNKRFGTVVGLDYRGEKVLAAHEPVDVLNLGIVAKTDLADIDAPFIRSTLAAGAVALAFVLAGIGVFFWIGTPIIARLEAQTRQLRAEVAQRQEVEDRLRAFMDSASEGFVILDSNLEFFSINQVALELFAAGSTEDHLRGKHILEIAPDFEASGMCDAYLQVVRTGRPMHFDGVLAGPQFADRIFTLDAFSTGDGVGIVFSDITERRRVMEELDLHRDQLERLVRERTMELNERATEAEHLNSGMVNVLEDLQASNAKLEAASRDLQASCAELDAFSYSVSHDLRAPLRHISGFLTLLIAREKDRLDAKSSHYVETIAGAAERMGQLIDDLLSFSRTSRTELRLQSIDSNQVVQESRKELSSLTEGRRITWDISDLPAVWADASLLRQVWQNLLGNAIKYTSQREDAHIEIGTTGEGAKEGTDEVVFFVRDNGVGFDPQYTSKLFGVFQRLHRNDEFEGTGIGLATVNRIVSRFGGRVWAEGAVGQGATFYFTLKEAGKK